jgi:dTDP-4-amino-4,6-dideoxygalactose transaminase
LYRIRNKNDFSAAKRAAREVLSLPIFPELTDPQIRLVAMIIKGFFKK